MIDKETVDRLRGTYDRLQGSKFIPRDQLEKGYIAFRNRFGPDQLAQLDGETLLGAMHGRGEYDSLVYWLEFKNDEELRSVLLGGIGGGTALKFGIFFRRETDTWFAAGGAPGGHEISVQEAIGIARKQRDELIAGSKLLANLPSRGTDADYRRLQEQMNEVAPAVAGSAWGHKYFHLVAPDKVDDYHNPAWQRFYLRKLLQLPPEGDGRFLCAGRFVELAYALDLPMSHATWCLGAEFGRLHGYWRIGASDGQHPRNRWEMMRDGNFVAVGWDSLDDLTEVLQADNAKDQIRQMLAEREPNQPATLTKSAKQLVDFGRTIARGDLVVVADGGTVLGIGRITGDYVFVPSATFRHHRDVQWLSLEEWPLPQREGLQIAVCALGKYPENLVEIERHIQLGTPPPPPPPPHLPGIPGRIQAVLERKSQVILYGPPGTGKTYWAERTARDLAARRLFGKSFDELAEKERSAILGSDHQPGHVRLCCFHPAYGYEDFIEGYRPKTIDGRMSFKLRSGIFRRLCRDAIAAGDRKPFYLIVDEINRGDIPRIFGELLTVLEKDKRGKSIVLPVSGKRLRVPSNVFLIGTMNTADRSISLLDAALRRRFGFVELMPDSGVLKRQAVAEIPLDAWLDALNRRIRKHVERDARNLQIGHAYLFRDGRPLRDFDAFRHALRDDILPLLEEYCYDDFEALKGILGKSLVDAERRCVRPELFELDGEEQLRTALLEIANESEALPSRTATEQQNDDAYGADDDTEEGE